MNDLPPYHQTRNDVKLISIIVSRPYREPSRHRRHHRRRRRSQVPGRRDSGTTTHPL